MEKSLRFFLFQISKNKKGGASFSQLRHFFNWRKSLEPDASSVKDKQPWVTYDVINFLKANLKPKHKVFEFGGGGSTLFLVKAVAEVITVEHNKEWFEILQKLMIENNYSNWKGVFLAADKGDLFSVPSISLPEHYSSDDEPSRGYHYKTYASYIDNFKNDYFDCVIIDGRSRPACILHSLSKIKIGGWLIVDNSDREYYFTNTGAKIKESFKPLIDNWGASPYSDEFTKTTVWKRIR